MSTTVADTTFDCMGCRFRVLVEGGTDPQQAAFAAEQLLHDIDARLSRFQPESEISRFNSDPRETVPASALLRQAVSTAVAAAERSGGQVDPTLLDPLEAAGYRETRVGMTPLPVAEALRDAPARRPATPSTSRSWSTVVVDDHAETISRPPGLRIDVGGTAKGLAADLAADVVAGFSPDRFLIDCAGDLVIGGTSGEPYEVGVEHPVTGTVVLDIPYAKGGMATSGINRRCWRGDDGVPRHHLLDPATGAPAWTGLAGATALATTAAEAETIAKMALLAGPERGRSVLARAGGGVLLHEDGRAEPVALPRPRPVVRLADLRAMAR